MTTALAHREQPTGGALAMWDAEQIHVLRTLICPDANDAEFVLFGQVCKRTGLDPFSKQIYAIKRKGKLTIQTGIDGFRLQAQRSHDYAGQEGPQWCGEDGIWRDVWLSKDAPSAARVGVYRKGYTRPVWGVATWAEYAQMHNGQPADMWARMPSNQLAKCAEAQALRKAFPAELSGVYSKDEMAQADNHPIVDLDEELPPVDWNAAWHMAVKGTRFADDDTRHKFISYHTQGKHDSLTAFLAVATREESAALLRAIQQRIAAEAKKAAARAELETEARQVIEDVRDAGGTADVPDDLATMSDAEIREMIDPLKEALGELEAVPA